MSTPDEQASRPLTRRELRELRARTAEPSVDHDASEAAAEVSDVAPEQKKSGGKKSSAKKSSGASKKTKASQPTEPEAGAADGVAPTDASEPADVAESIVDADPVVEVAHEVAPPAEQAAPLPEPEKNVAAHPPLTRREMRQLRTNEVPVVSAELAAAQSETPSITQPDLAVSTTVFEMPKLDPAFGAGVGLPVTRENQTFDALMEQGPHTSPSAILGTRSHLLPAGVGSTGAAYGTTDGRDIDAVLIDGELPAASRPTPIAASAAISTQKSAADVLRPPSPEKGRGLLLTLGITAGVLGIVAVGTLATLYFTGAFN